MCHVGSVTLRDVPARSFIFVLVAGQLYQFTIFYQFQPKLSSFVYVLFGGVRIFLYFLSHIYDINLLFPYLNLAKSLKDA
jgi:hypothetical protein